MVASSLVSGFDRDEGVGWPEGRFHTARDSDQQSQVQRETGEA